MHFSLSLCFVALVAGQAYAQSASGHYFINDNTGSLTAEGFAVFEHFNGSPTQIWDFAPVGREIVVIQNQAEGNYLNCQINGSPCSVAADPQIFNPHSFGGDYYEIWDETNGFVLVENQDRTVQLVQAAEAGQRSLFKLARSPQCKL